MKKPLSSCLRGRDPNSYPGEGKDVADASIKEQLERICRFLFLILGGKPLLDPNQRGQGQTSGKKLPVGKPCSLQGS